MSKKIVSAILTIALIASMFTLVFVVPSSADFEIAADTIIPFCEAFNKYQAVVDFFGTYGDETTETITQVIVDGQDKGTTTVVETKGAYAKDLAEALAKYPNEVKALADTYALYLVDDGHDDQDLVKAKTYKLYDVSQQSVVAAYQAIEPIYQEFVKAYLSYGIENAPAHDMINGLYLDVYTAVAQAKLDGKYYDEKVYNEFMAMYESSYAAEEKFASVNDGDFSKFETPAELEEAKKTIALAVAYFESFDIASLDIKEVIYVEKIVEKVVEKIVYKEVNTSDN